MKATTSTYRINKDTEFSLFTHAYLTAGVLVNVTQSYMVVQPVVLEKVEGEGDDTTYTYISNGDKVRVSHSSGRGSDGNYWHRIPGTNGLVQATYFANKFTEEAAKAAERKAYNDEITKQRRAEQEAREARYQASVKAAWERNREAIENATIIPLPFSNISQGYAFSYIDDAGRNQFMVAFITEGKDWDGNHQYILNCNPTSTWSVKDDNSWEGSLASRSTIRGATLEEVWGQATMS